VKDPAVENAMALLVAPGAMVPVLQAPLSEVAVCATAVVLAQVTVEPIVTWIGFGLKHHGGVPAQLTIWAGVLAALAASDPSSHPGTTMTRASRSRRIG
jgi:hypothetical protein